MDVLRRDVTLLFTDIEGSTRLWENAPDAMAEALRRHDEILREVIELHQGHVFKTVGDAFCAAFSSAEGGVLAAIGAQRRLSAEPWPPAACVRVRMGLHSGRCEERGGDYFGPVVNRAARLEASAHGGQVVVSEVTASLARTWLGPTISLDDLGVHCLKDMSQPERIFQVRADGLEPVFPPLRTVPNPTRKNNLPHQASSFVGREQELAQVRGLLQSSRLVTLTGPGGTGKTRLALKAAAEVDGVGDGVWFADLAPLRDPAAVPHEVASVLEVAAGPGPGSLDGLAFGLATRSLLLVLDNCEHLIQACAQLVDSLLRRCPGVVVLATSREPLGVAGEHVVRVPPLGLPADGGGADPVAEVAASEATVLFVDRATAHDDDFVLDSSTAPPVISICRRLDGLPLALELAAARLPSMTVFELEERLSDHLRLLKAGARSSLGRQQTMSALIEWSYELLTQCERSTFERLSVFAGPFDLAAAIAVVQGGAQELEAEEALFSLVDKSLVQPETGRVIARYKLLESIRQFAEERLRAAGLEEREGTRARLVAHYMAFAARAEAELFGPDEETWIDRLAEEQPNLLAALSYADSGIGTDDWGLALASSLYDYWLMEEPALGAEVLERALAHDTSAAPSGLRVKALWVLAEQHQHNGQDERAIELCNEAFPMAIACGDLASAAQCRKIAANAHAGRGELESATSLMVDARQLANRSRDRLVIAQVAHDASILQMSAGDVEAARAGFHDALARFEEVGAARHALLASVNLGNIAEEAGDLAEARSLFASAFDHLRHRPRGLVGPLAGLIASNLAALSITQGDVNSALDYLPTVTANSRFHPAATLVMVALAASAAGDCDTASRLHGAADALRQRSGLGASMTDAGERYLLSDRDALRANKAVDFERLYASGVRLGEKRALDLASHFVSKLGGRRHRDLDGTARASHKG